MRKIVDRNYLQSPKLRDYLAKWRKHRVVLTDYAAMEAFKGDALANIASATEILREFPKQIIVLKSTSSIATLKGRRCGFTRRMIDRDQTRGFPEWCEHTARALAGDKDLQRQIVENGIEADAHLKRMRDEQENYAENLDAMAKNFSEAELKALRKHEPISEEMFGKIQSHVLEMAAFLFAAHPHVTELPPAQELPYRFIFRYTMAGYLVALRWMSVGGARNVKPEKISKRYRRLHLCGLRYIFPRPSIRRRRRQRDLRGHQILSRALSRNAAPSRSHSSTSNRLLDRHSVGADDFLVARQLTIKNGEATRRPDLVVFLNGLPVAVFELKDPSDEEATLWTAYDQLQDYKAVVPALFAFNEILVISDGDQSRVGSLPTSS